MAESVARGGAAGALAQTRAFLEGARVEIKKVTWPSREELYKATRMILILSILLGVAIGMLDWLLQLIFVRGIAVITQ
jgi:preprotein translocase subunit SecE